jgi:hypothetical protein
MITESHSNWRFLMLMLMCLCEFENWTGYSRENFRNLDVALIDINLTFTN